MSITVGDLYKNRKSGRMVRVTEVRKQGVMTAYLNNRPGIYITFNSLIKLYLAEEDKNILRLIKENNNRYLQQENIDEEFVRKFITKHKEKK